MRSLFEGEQRVGLARARARHAVDPDLGRQHDDLVEEPVVVEGVQPRKRREDPRDLVAREVELVGVGRVEANRLLLAARRWRRTAPSLIQPMPSCAK